MRIQHLAGLVAGATVLGMGSVAMAHPGHGVSGFGAGIAHPLSGLDHILAMVAVGIWAAQVGGKARWLLPLSFLGFMVVGGVVGFAVPTLPFADAAVATTVLLLGLLIATATRLPLAAGMLVTGAFALCHGYAHGAELPAGSSAGTFAMGFVVAMVLLHLVGLGVGMLAMKKMGAKWVRVAGVGIVAGAVIVFASLV